MESPHTPKFFIDKDSLEKEIALKPDNPILDLSVSSKNDFHIKLMVSNTKRGFFIIN